MTGCKSCRGRGYIWAQETGCGTRRCPDCAKPRCNFCGESCALSGSMNSVDGLEAVVHGGYWSTPGNGEGALDDCTSYKFALCEFCLDWLFEQFVVPVETSEYADTESAYAPWRPWRPARQRVVEDGWRKQKEKFFAEAARRAALRKVSGR